MPSATDSVFAATGPIFLLILAGFLAVRLRLFDAGQMRVLGRFVTLIALPALLVRALSSRPLAEILHPRFLLVYAIGSLVSFGLGWLWARRARQAGTSKAALMAVGVACSNSAFVGYPIAAQLLGPTAGVALALVMLVENLLIIPLAFALADAGPSQMALAQRLQAQGRMLVRNPLLVAIVVGISIAALQIPVPAMVQQTIQIVAGSASPLALFVIGGALVGLKPGGMLADVGAIAIGKLVLHPLCVLGALALLPLADPGLQRAALIYACVPMMGIYAVLAQKYALDALCAAALLVAMVLSFVSINLWLAWF